MKKKTTNKKEGAADDRRAARTGSSRKTKVGKKSAASKKASGKNAANGKGWGSPLLRRLMKMAKNDPQLPLPEFVTLVNRVVARFVPEGVGDGRVTDAFNGRTIRHYQNKGIIDPPERRGKVGYYGYRQVLQALLTRRLLAEGYRAARIANLLGEKPNEDLIALLRGGAEVELRPAMTETGGGGAIAKERANAALRRGPWFRLSVVPGLEIHLARGFTLPETKEEAMSLRKRLNAVLTEELQERRDCAKKKAARRSSRGFEDEAEKKPGRKTGKKVGAKKSARKAARKAARNGMKSSE